MEEAKPSEKTNSGLRVFVPVLVGIVFGIIFLCLLVWIVRKIIERKLNQKFKSIKGKERVEMEYEGVSQSFEDLSDYPTIKVSFGSLEEKRENSVLDFSPEEVKTVMKTPDTDSNSYFPEERHNNNNDISKDRKDVQEKHAISNFEETDKEKIYDSNVGTGYKTNNTEVVPVDVHLSRVESNSNLTKYSPLCSSAVEVA
ncbi:uncharacterized protein LOC106471275 [Limulus polyphemus]|uniref:Uncharacterized protein LOC106471275 n=1 Tax=Limulus polyphemus TaxID=6850 RepID=A0ABM1TI88_LIMPO|nr:uncharacterized protein LOC106471275 [Limulus polyphemus]XP_022255594.1 uncharacterized protein LOC106471275 [Limulus polyphemus]